MGLVLGKAQSMVWEREQVSEMVDQKALEKGQETGLVWEMEWE